MGKKLYPFLKMFEWFNEVVKKAAYSNSSHNEIAAFQ
jgi:hypothetical protein